MGKNASGVYVIDADYNIVSYNHAAEIIYPELKKGEKCYRCLMHEENPCAECPVVNGIEGPKNYLETKQKVLRSIDAVEIRNINRIIRKDPEHKVHLLLEYAGDARDIADPWYTGNFDETYEDVLEGCEGFLKYLKEHGEIQ